jgi:hypothetical protein
VSARDERRHRSAISITVTARRADIAEVDAAHADLLDPPALVQIDPVRAG